ILHRLFGCQLKQGLNAAQPCPSLMPLHDHPLGRSLNHFQTDPHWDPGEQSNFVQMLRGYTLILPHPYAEKITRFSCVMIGLLLVVFYNFSWIPNNDSVVGYIANNHSTCSDGDPFPNANSLDDASTDSDMGSFPNGNVTG